MNTKSPEYLIECARIAGRRQASNGWSGADIAADYWLNGGSSAADAIVDAGLCDAARVEFISAFADKRGGVSLR